MLEEVRQTGMGKRRARSGFGGRAALTDLRTSFGLRRMQRAPLFRAHRSRCSWGQDAHLITLRENRGVRVRDWEGMSCSICVRLNDSSCHMTRASTYQGQ